MFQIWTVITLVVFSLFFLLAPFAVNAYYQRKSRFYADEMLAENVAEFNKQIKANAIIVLIRRSFWGLLALSGIIWNFSSVWQQRFHWLTFGVIFIGIACFAFGIWGYQTEIKRLKSLE